MRLQGKTAIVPGAARPIGRAIAGKLAEQGANLVLPYFDWPESILEMKEEFEGKKYPFLAFPVDLRSREQVKNMVREVTEKFGALHILINNIERGGMPVLHGSYDHEQNKDQWELELSTCLHAKWLLFHYCLPLMKQSGAGTVINISSIAAIVGRSGSGAVFFSDGYSAANQAISSLTRTWAREAAPDIRVNELMLGLINSRHGKKTRGWSLLKKEEKKRLYNQILLDRIGTPEDVAETILFMVSQASYMTGAIIRLDGGFTLGSDQVPPIPDTNL